MKSAFFLNRTALLPFFNACLLGLIVVLSATSCDHKKEPARPGKEEAQTLELTVKDVDAGNQFALSMTPRQGAGPWVFTSTEPHPWLGIPLERKYIIPEAEMAKVDILDDGKGNFTVTDIAGNPTDWKGTYTVQPGPADNEITYKGMLTDGISHLEFTGVTDPAPLVIIAVAGIGAAICALVVALDDCENSTAIEQLIEACRENGGKPQLTITTTYGVSFSPFRLGCGTDCSFECK
ncbi:MAG: hypothetical protein KDD19_10540 [Phaeodactylibacter sp.]|nr:hypothetical protein [Phaeodactylibacter sp.]MCB9054176.1 hypothetical protein [Lewinellaceae bacterium]